MSEAKRYEAVHLRYEDSNIRYGEGCEVEVVAAYDYDTLRAANQRLEGEVARLREALELWLANYDEVAENPDFEPFPHVAERVAKTRAALAGTGEE